MDPTPQNRVAIIGAGPAVFFAAEALLKSDSNIAIDIFDKKPVPFGLVRFGVAPDHPKIKAVTKKFSKVLDDPRVRFFGNVQWGRDITLDEGLARYHQLLFSIGAPLDFHLGIPGEQLDGVFAARAFVGWFNTDSNDAALKGPLERAKKVFVIGIGNVAMDVARVLARPVEDLEKTDIADHALEPLRNSAVEEIHLVARRGPLQIACTYPELKELTELPTVDVVVDESDFEGISLNEGEVSKDLRKSFELLKSFIGRSKEGRPITLHFDFLYSPREFVGSEESLRRIVLQKNRLEQVGEGQLKASPAEQRPLELEADLVFRAIRYKGEAFAGLPFDERAGVIPNESGRVRGVDRVYVAGWVKRGASGIIGTNKPDAGETVRAMLEDAGQTDIELAADGAERLLDERGVQCVTKEDWQRIDEEELRRGAEQGRDRVRFVHWEEIRQFLAS